MRVTTHLYPVLMSTAVPLLPLYTFVAWEGATLPLLLSVLMYNIFKGSHLSLTSLSCHRTVFQLPLSISITAAVFDISVVLLVYIHN
jgi:hypothetical protein